MLQNQHRYSRYFPLIFLVADLGGLNLSFLFSTWLLFDELVISDSYSVLLILLNVIWVTVFFSSKLQKVDRDSRLLDHLNRVLTALVVNLSIVFALWFMLQPDEYSRKFLFYTYSSYTVATLIWRSVWHYSIRAYRAKGYNYRNVLIVGKSTLSDSLIRYIKETPFLGYKIVKILNVQNVHQLPEQCQQYDVDVLFCCLPNLNEMQVREIIDFAESHLIKVNLFSQFSKLINHNLKIESLGNIPVINVNTIPLDLPVNRFIKRTFDLVFSAIIFLLFLSWFFPVIAILIKLESKGPVFFRQQRHGRDNNLFKIYKFRSMYVHDGKKVVQASKSDSRITKIGALLRKSSIDELPQFLNVLKGEMSVVGPRPHAVQHNIEYQPQIDKFWQRHAVKPGITGLAQAKGFRGETPELSDMSGRVKLDRFYVKNWSLVLDFKIIILTAVSVIKGDGNAY